MMAHTEFFYVSNGNDVIRICEPTDDCLQPDGELFNKAKYIIEVFGYNHSKTANEIRDMVDKSNMGNKLFTIKVETR